MDNEWPNIQKLKLRLEIEPENAAEIWEELAFLYFDASDEANFQKASDTAIALGLKSADLHSLRGHFFSFSTGGYLDLEKAEKEYRSALKLDPVNTRALSGFAACCLERGKGQLEALKMLNEGLRRSNSSASVYRARSDIYFYLKDYDKAEEDIICALSRLDSENSFELAQNIERLGQICSLKGDMDAARELARKAFSLYREEGLVPFSIIQLAIEISSVNTDHCLIEEFLSASSDIESNPYCLYLRAVIHKDLGEREKAIERLLQAESILAGEMERKGSYDYSVVHSMLENLFYTDICEKEWYTASLESRKIYNNAVKMGSIKGAIAELDRAISENGGVFPRARSLKAKLLWESGDIAKSADEAKKAAKESPNEFGALIIIAKSKIEECLASKAIESEDITSKEKELKKSAQKLLKAFERLSSEGILIENLTEISEGMIDVADRIRQSRLKFPYETLIDAVITIPAAKAFMRDPEDIKKLKAVQEKAKRVLSKQ